MRYIGIDPGPTPGIAVLEVDAGRLWETDVVQCTARLVVPIAVELAHSRVARIVLERFVVRGRTNAAQTLTRDQVAALQQVLTVSGSIVSLRNAQPVKAWATDQRLDAVGLLSQTKGMRHARDAARHALFAAVHDGAIPDPLSRTSPHKEN